ncbi:MAG: AMIN domain-containing protein [Persicimonas sp.]
MRLIRYCASAAALALLATAFASPADAQTIRNYGDSDSGGGSSSGSSSDSDSAQPWYPGMAQPEQSSGDDQQAQPEGEGEGDEEGEGEGEEEDAIGPSHRISVFSGKKSDPNAPRTTLDLAIDQLYRGVIPGTRDEVAHLARARESSSSGSNQLTWLGFRPDDEKTRVFFQTARDADYRIERDKQAHKVVIELDDTKIAARNFARFIDTSYFKRNVKRVEAKKAGSNKVEITIELDAFEQPTVRRDGTYVYLDFPHKASDGQGSDEQVAGGSDSQ